MADYFFADSEEDYSIAAMLFKEYAAWLNIDLGFQHFDEELKEIRTMYGKPGGGIILCKEGKEIIGCVGIRKIDNDTAELKRMFIKAVFQNKGIGKSLLQHAIEFAREHHYRVIRLDTLNYMIPAIKLYKNAGFYEIPAYYNNPNETAVYFEMKC
ncbi:MAG: GNAT family N-acetyltransferase [Ferruginibacter sp.]